MNISGEDIILYVKTTTGKDDFNRDVVTETPVTVGNVVIGHPTADDITSEINLSGKIIAYTLAIPAGDTHIWEGATVEFYGRKWKTIGIPGQFKEGFMGKNFPWNKQVKVEAYG